MVTFTIPPSVTTAFPEGAAGKVYQVGLFDLLQGLETYASVSQLGVTHVVQTVAAMEALRDASQLTAGKSVVWVFADPAHTVEDPVNGLYLWTGSALIPSTSPHLEDIGQATGDFAALVAAKTSEVNTAAAGFDALALAKIDALGFFPPVAYADGVEVTSVRYTVSQGGGVYFPKAELLPFTTPDPFDASQWLKLPLDAELQQAIADVAALETDAAELRVIAAAISTRPPLPLASNAAGAFTVTPNLNGATPTDGDLQFAGGQFIGPGGVVTLSAGPMTTPFKTGGPTLPLGRFWVVWTGAGSGMKVVDWSPSAGFREWLANGTSTPYTPAATHVALACGLFPAGADAIGAMISLVTPLVGSVTGAEAPVWQGTLANVSLNTSQSFAGVSLIYGAGEGQNPTTGFTHSTIAIPELEFRIVNGPVWLQVADGRLVQNGALTVGSWPTARVEARAPGGAWVPSATFAVAVAAPNTGLWSSPLPSRAMTVGIAITPIALGPLWNDATTLTPTLVSAPPGLSLRSASAPNDWEIYGTPQIAGTFLLRVQDATGQVVERSYTVDVPFERVPIGIVGTSEILREIV